MKALATLMAVIAWFSSAAVCAADRDTRPTIGLVLSGGGARGGAHVGILQALEELGIRVDYIAGTSMGAIIGGLYAAGYTVDDIATILAETDWNEALSDQPARRDRTMRKKELEDQFQIPHRVGFNRGKLQLPLGVVEGQHLDQIFQRILMPVNTVRDFDRLPIPFRAVATDLVTGDEVVLAGGSLPDALRASMSVPGVFAPVILDDRMLVDGGMSNNLPVTVVREMGADIVIAVDISSPLLAREDLTSVVSVTEQLTNFLTRRNTEYQISQMGPDDVLIVPALGDFSAADFAGAKEIVSLGYDAVMALTERILSLAGEAPATRVPIVSTSAPVIEFIEVNNGSKLHDGLISSRLAVTVGQPLDLDELENSLDRIYSLDVFESVTYDLKQNEQGQQGIVVGASPRDWGPNYLQFGLELASDFSGSSDFQLRANYTRNALNALGGEFRLVAGMGREDELSFDFYQPIDLEARWFIEPELHWRRENYNLWLDDQNIANFEIAGWGTRFSLGRNFSTTDKASLKYEFARANADIITGDIDVTEDELDIGELVLEYRHDSLDSLWFPSEGMSHRLAYLWASEAIGAWSDYDQAMANGSVVISWGKNSTLFNYELGYSFDDRAPLERWFRLGGLGRLSGLIPLQLSGRQIGLATLAYYRRLNDFELLQAYAGATIEAGNVWDYSADIGFDDLRWSTSLFFGAKTPLGPVYLALGYHESGDSAIYFYVGNPFRISRFD